MDLTDEDVTDILALLDSLPYDELDLQTPRFRLVLRRTPDGWTQCAETRSAPNALTPPGPPSASASASVSGEGAPASPLGAGSMALRPGHNRPNGTSIRSASNMDGADEVGGAEEAVPGAEEAVPGAEEAVPGAEEAVPGGEEAVPGGEEAVPGGEGAVPGAEGAAGEGEEAGGELVAVRAPLPGTFYRAPRPGAAPFVEVGSRVGAEDVVGIVETMKLMNSVIAGVDGTVAEICVGNGEFAANGATLLRIRAD